MTRKEVISLFKKHKPKTAKAAIKLGIKLKYLSSGVYRDAYYIQRLGIVIKFPRPLTKKYGKEWHECNLNHAQLEIDALNTIWYVSKVLSKHLPKVYYIDRDNGVIIVKKYKIDFKYRYYKFAYKIAQILGLDGNNTDYCGSNIGIDTDGTKILLDLGLR